MKASARNRGFTLVEIAIVLVIIGLLLGGVLKGQELINTAKVRAIADRQSALKIAWFSFIERYSAIPGDYNRANIYLTNAGNGDGSGMVENGESALALQHLTAAGYIRCAQCTSTVSSSAPSSANSLLNNYGGVMSLWTDGTHHLDTTGTAPAGDHSNTAATGGKSSPIQVHTGPSIPSNIIGQVDQKIDDGLANSGDMMFNRYNPVATTGPNVKKCTVSSQSPSVGGSYSFKNQALIWRPESLSPPIESNCGASVII